MAYDVSKTSEELASQIEIKPNLIVEIEGIDLVISSVPVFEIARWDKDGIYWDDENTFWDGLVEKSESRSYIDFSQTTKNITQQIILDRGGSSSVASMNIQITNKDLEISRAFAFENITEILGKKCNVYLNWAEGSHPEDSTPLFRGFIDDFSDLTTSSIISVSHSENHKRVSFLDIYNSKTTEALKYKDFQVQNIFYSQRDKTQENLTLTYVLGGSLLATITANDIIVNITSGSTASDIVRAVREASDVNYVVDARVIGDGSIIQTPIAQTNFTIDTNVELESTDGIFPSKDMITTYIRINDEIMQIINIVDEFNFEVLRAQLTSFGSSHGLGDDAASIYRITERPIQMALKIMMSEEGNEFYESTDIVEAFQYVDDSTFIENGIIFSNLNIEEHTGLTNSDFLRIENSPLNSGDFTVDNFGVLEDGRSYITVKENLQTETVSEPTVSYKSKYDVLATGLGMQPNEVDIAGFEKEEETYGINFVEHDFEINETIESAKEFIDTEVLFSQGLYSIPRKARASVKFTSAPLSSEQIPVFDVNTIIGIEKLKQKRSIHKYFYNNVAYSFDYDVLFDKYKSSRYLISEDSFNRIKKVGNKQLLIENKGLQANNETFTVIDRISNRFIDRYKFAARYIENVQVLYKVGYRLEIGDVVQFGGENTKMTNLETGERDFPVRLFEIVNKKLNAEKSLVYFDILETGYSIEGSRYGVISPASKIKSGTTTRLILKKFLDCGVYAFERDKWNGYIGCKLLIRSKDWDYEEEVTFEAFDEFNNEAIIISELSQAPTEDLFVEFARYDSQPLSDVGDRIKLQYTFNMFYSVVTSGIDNSNFEVEDISGFVVDQYIEVRSPDYIRDSKRVKIINIVGNQITLESDISFVPELNDFVQALSMASDLGDGYFLV